MNEWINQSIFPDPPTHQKEKVFLRSELSIFVHLLLFSGPIHVDNAFWNTRPPAWGYRFVMTQSHSSSKHLSLHLRNGWIMMGFCFSLAVVGCNKLKNTEWISRQDPYVCLEYANTKFRTRTCTGTPSISIPLPYIPTPHMEMESTPFTLLLFFGFLNWVLFVFWLFCGLDGGKNPTFREKFVFSLIEGLRELNVNVWNSNSLTQDDFIGSTR